MKFNWGHGITIVIIGFVGFIMLMVIKAFNTSSDLTAENYYSQELTYGERITAISNSNGLSGGLIVVMDDETVRVVLPEELQGQGVEGQIYFYRPDDAEKDLVTPIDSSSNTQRISKTNLVSGNYSLQVNCTKEGKEYFFEQGITITK